MAGRPAWAGQSRSACRHRGHIAGCRRHAQGGEWGDSEAAGCAAGGCSTRAAACVFQQQSGINRPCTPHPPEGGHPIRGPVGAAGAGCCCDETAAGVGSLAAPIGHGMAWAWAAPGQQHGVISQATSRACSGVQACRRAGVQVWCREVHVVPLAPSMPMCLRRCVSTCSSQG